MYMRYIRIIKQAKERDQRMRQVYTEDCHIKYHTSISSRYLSIKLYHIACLPRQLHTSTASLSCGQLVIIKKLNIQRMFGQPAACQHPLHSPPSNQLSNKRDRYRVEIRRTVHKERQSQRRTLLINSLSNLQLELLEDLARTEENALTEHSRDELIGRLQDCADNRDIILKVAQLKLVKKLTNYLKTAENVQYKCRIVEILMSLIYYERQTFQEFIEESIVDFVLSEVNIKSWRQDPEYLCLLLKLVRNLSSEVQVNFNLYLKDASFCSKVCTKMQQQSVKVPEAVKQLMKIRTNLILTKDSPPTYELFQQTIQYLRRDSLNQSHYPQDYLSLLISLIKTVDQKTLFNRLTDEQDVMIDLENIITKTLPSYEELEEVGGRQKKALVVKILHFIRAVIDKNGALLEYLHRVGLPNKEIFLWALNCPSGTVSRYSVKVFADYVEYYVDRFRHETTEDIENIIKTILDKHWNDKSLTHTLNIVEFFTTNKIWYMATQILLKNNILSRLQQFLQSQFNKDSNRLETILNIYQKLLNFGDTQHSNGNKILRTLQNRGIIPTIMALQSHQDRSVSERVGRLSSQYFQNLTETSGFEADT